MSRTTQNTTKGERITIVGAGLVGSLLAILLARRGYKVDVVERRPDPRTGKIVGGRSINLALSDRGLLALARAGIAKEVEDVAIAMRGRMVHVGSPALPNGPPALLPYGTGDQAIRSVSRGGLNTTLIGLAAAEPNVTMHFERKCAAVDLHAPSLTLEAPDGTRTVHTADIVIGADGASSAVRAAFASVPGFSATEEPLEHGYKELNIPAGPGGGWRLEKHALHIWPRESHMLIALPNLDGSFTGTFFFPLEGPESFAALDGPEKARVYFARTYPTALALMPTFDEDWVNNPVSQLSTLRCAAWVHGDKVMLIGDAAHAIVPFFGQGMNAGFEDCRVLMDILDATNDDWSAALPRYQAARKENADAIALLALENFVEMRDKVADPTFLLHKAIERRLAMLLPHVVVPKYTMVTFSPDISYADALRRGRALDAVLERAATIPNIGADLTSGKHDDALRRLAAVLT